MLTRVTVTGADDAVDPRALMALGVEFPFVEWGVLMSESRQGTPRYPTRRWMIGLENTAKDAMRTATAMNLSAHFCGAVAREALAGRLHDLPVIERVRRIQVNGYAPPSPGLVSFARRMPSYGDRLAGPCRGPVAGVRARRRADGLSIASVRPERRTRRRAVQVADGPAGRTCGIRRWHHARQRT